MDKILIIMKKKKRKGKWPKGFICPCTWVKYHNIGICRRSPVSVYRIIGPLVFHYKCYMKLLNFSDTKQTAQKVIHEKLLEEMMFQNLKVGDQVIITTGGLHMNNFLI